MTTRRTYGVRLERGAVLELPAHAEACTDEQELLQHAENLPRPLAADLFCGAGGLSLGLQAAGFHVAVGVDHDAVALATHRAHFPGLTLQRDLSDPAAVREIGLLLKRLQVDLIAGGPPCQPFSRAGRSKIRSLVETGQRTAHDSRRDLWQAFLEIVEIAQPRAVLVENVPDMALGDDMLVLRTLTTALEDLGYGVHSRLLDAWRFGVPQHRQRLILVGLANQLDFVWPQTADGRVTVRDAIGDLPAVEGGWRSADGQSMRYASEPLTGFQKEARRHSGDVVSDHITRPVRADDRQAFDQMDASTTYAQLDDALKRYRDDIFVDKYKRLGWDELSRTITAHLARDGYWYIHPDQPRTLTVREAARLQTFPDHIRFSGPPTGAFRQIGNAVPPRLGEVVGRQIRQALANPLPAPTEMDSVAQRLIVWWYGMSRPSRPWLLERRALPAVLGEMLLTRVSLAAADAAWSRIRHLATAADALASSDLIEDAALVAGRTARVPSVQAALERIVEHPDDLTTSEGLRRVPGLSAASVAMVTLAALEENPVVVAAPALRAAGRFFGIDAARNKQTDGRMAIARLVGGRRGANATHLALVELGATVCLPEHPRCDECPLARDCVFRRSVTESASLDMTAL